MKEGYRGGYYMSGCAFYSVGVGNVISLIPAVDLPWVSVMRWYMMEIYAKFSLRERLTPLLSFCYT